MANEIGEFVFASKMRRTVEIGMSFGTTAYPILNAHSRLGMGGLHVNVQPNAYDYLDAVAPVTVKRLGFEKHSRVVSMLSHQALP